MAEQQLDPRQVTDWVFDLDNTLYPADVVFSQIDRRMTQFVAGYLGIGADEALALQKAYYVEHGNTLKGMMDAHGMAPGGFLHHAHEVDLSAVPRCERLPAAMATLEGRKFIYTNGTRRHADRMAAHLGIDHLLDGISGIDDGAYHPKPDPRSYSLFCETHGVDPAGAVFFDDMPRNLLAAHQMGFTTVHVVSHDVASHDVASDATAPGGPAFTGPRTNGDDGAAHIHYLTCDLAAFLEQAAS
jgi:putative hydrolase of the HAD superfamily